MRFWTEIKDHPIRFLKTAGLWSCFVSLGMSLAIVGPTLLDLRHQVSTSIKEVSFALAARAGGQAIGSLVSECKHNALIRDEKCTTSRLLTLSSFP